MCRGSGRETSIHLHLLVNVGGVRATMYVGGKPAKGERHNKLNLLFRYVQVFGAYSRFYFFVVVVKGNCSLHRTKIGVRK